MKIETCKLYSRAFWIFLQNIIKISSIPFRAIPLQSWAVFLRHSVLWNITSIHTL